ncbi:hypothetical protein LWI29_033685 [Acer saccharum]|uniref:Uncharacterized protein n=1 Tax=Acer saccharum TaxID=4024 RepID=A0AA39W7F3_ACESA|nr:hypothetical protein LWI29_033685 [Acer saccharum]
MTCKANHAMQCNSFSPAMTYKANHSMQRNSPSPAMTTDRMLCDFGKERQTPELSDLLQFSGRQIIALKRVLHLSFQA